MEGLVLARLMRRGKYVKAKRVETRKSHLLISLKGKPVKVWTAEVFRLLSLIVARLFKIHGRMLLAGAHTKN